MFRIDKNQKKFRKRGHALASKFLCQCWDNNSLRYINCNFNEFRKNGLIEKLLVEEQRGFCCYCMRHLEYGKHTTIEHVMPQNCKTKSGVTDWDKVNYYKNFNRLFKERVVYAHLNGTTNQWTDNSAFPHFCAYENLTLSCDGSLFTDEDKEQGFYPSKLHYCCNNRRGNDTIIPLFFVRHIEKYIGYDRNDGGIIILTNNLTFQKQLSDAIDSLNIDNERLQIIRRTWCRISSSDYSISDVVEGIDDTEKRKIIMMDSGVPISDFKRIDNKIYWELLSEYYWFYKYFKKIK